MPQISDINQEQNLAKAIVSTLAFFSLYDLPLTSQRVWELLLGVKCSLNEVEQTLQQLVQANRIVQSQNLFALKKWDESIFQANQLALSQKLARVGRYFNWLAILPFVRQISIINSLALGTADSDSDIDFLVITKPNSLYFVRSAIIVLFRLLGVYKTRQKIKDRFCFGFFVTLKNLPMEHLMLKPADPYFMFWLANLRPIYGSQEYLALMASNAWINQAFPNFEFAPRLDTVRRTNWFVRFMKLILEILLWLPVQILEPILQAIHIRHTFRLQENMTPTSTTVADARMLKLHGYDVRAEIADRYRGLLQNLL